MADIFAKLAEQYEIYQAELRMSSRETGKEAPVRFNNATGEFTLPQPPARGTIRYCENRFLLAQRDILSRIPQKRLLKMSESERVLWNNYKRALRDLQQENAEKQEAHGTAESNTHADKNDSISFELQGLDSIAGFEKKEENPIPALGGMKENDEPDELAPASGSMKLNLPPQDDEPDNPLDLPGERRPDPNELPPTEGEENINPRQGQSVREFQRWLYKHSAEAAGHTKEYFGSTQGTILPYLDEQFMGASPEVQLRTMMYLEKRLWKKNRNDRMNEPLRNYQPDVKKLKGVIRSWGIRFFKRLDGSRWSWYKLKTALDQARADSAPQKAVDEQAGKSTDSKLSFVDNAVNGYKDYYKAAQMVGTKVKIIQTKDKDAKFRIDSVVEEPAEKYIFKGNHDKLVNAQKFCDGGLELVTGVWGIYNGVKKMADLAFAEGAPTERKWGTTDRMMRITGAFAGGVASAEGAMLGGATIAGTAGLWSMAPVIAAAATTALSFTAPVVQGLGLISDLTGIVKTSRAIGKSQESWRQANALPDDHPMKQKLMERAKLAEQMNRNKRKDLFVSAALGGLGLAATITALAVAGPVVAAVAGIAAIAFKFLGGKLAGLFAGRRNKRKAVDSAYLETQPGRLEQKKQILAEKIKENYNDPDTPAGVKARMRTQLSIERDSAGRAVNVKSSKFHHHLGNILRREEMAKNNHFSLNAAQSEIVKNMAKETIQAYNESKDIQPDASLEASINRNRLKNSAAKLLGSLHVNEKAVNTAGKNKNAVDNIVKSAQDNAIKL